MLTTTVLHNLVHISKANIPAMPASVFLQQLLESRLMLQVNLHLLIHQSWRKGSVWIKDSLGANFLQRSCVRPWMSLASAGRLMM